MARGTRVKDVGSGSLEVDGREIALTNLDKVLYPSTGTTKADVLQYYLGVAGVMLPHLADRIITRRKWPDGVEGEVFYEKNLPTWAPDWLRTVEIEHSDRTVTYPVARDRADLVWLAQSGALELHMPQWTVGPRGAHKPPNRLVLDLDPGPPAGLDACVEVALWLRERVAADGGQAFPVTSGSKGLQLYTAWPLAGAPTKDPSEYARMLAGEAAKALPALVVTTMTRSERPGKVYVDWSQNNPSKTTIAPYSLRGREEPRVAAPRTWKEVEDGGLDHLTAEAVLDRVRKPDYVDPLAPLTGGPAGRTRRARSTSARTRTRRK